MTSPEKLPEPEPLDADQIIKGLESVENKWEIPDLVSRFSPWVTKPEFAYDMLEYLRSEVEQRFGIDLFAEIRSALAAAQELTERKTSFIKKLGASAFNRAREIL